MNMHVFLPSVTQLFPLAVVIAYKSSELDEEIQYLLPAPVP
jgi:hypothetical protein